MQVNPPPATVPTPACLATEMVSSLRHVMKNPTNAIGRIYKILSALKTPGDEMDRLEIREGVEARIFAICQWVLLNDPEYIIDASDREALGLASPSSPASP